MIVSAKCGSGLTELPSRGSKILGDACIAPEQNNLSRSELSLGLFINVILACQGKHAGTGCCAEQANVSHCLSKMAHDEIRADHVAACLL